jgi:hypothetical protein
MTEDEIEDRRNDAAVHHYGLMTRGVISWDTYVSFMRDLNAWAESKRVELKRVSCGAGLVTDRSAKPGKRVRSPPTRPRPRRRD